MAPRGSRWREGLNYKSTCWTHTASFFEEEKPDLLYMEPSRILSPTPQHHIPLAALEARGLARAAPAQRTTSSKPDPALTAEKLSWLYASLSVLERQDQARVEEPLRIQLQRKLLLRLACEDDL